jgi:MFS family permease
MGGGLLLTAAAERIWVGYLTYGIGVGIGAACAYVPTMASVGGWFVTRRNAALGIAAAGTGCGMLVVPPVAAAVIGDHGWRAAYGAIGVGATLLLMVCAALVARPPAPQVAARRPLGPVVRSFPFLMLYLSWVLATTALFVPLVYLPAFALDRAASAVAASALLSVLGGMSILGRVGIGVLADWMGTLRLFKLSVLTMAASYLLWLLLPAYPWLVAFSAILGLGYGIRIALMPSVLIELFGVQSLGALLGIFFTASGVSAAIGPLLAGLIVDSSASYEWGIAFALAMGTLGFAALIPVKNPVR